MIKKNLIFFKYAFWGILLYSFAAQLIWTQDSDQLPEKYRRWLKEEVVYIITDAEHELFLSLKDDEAKEQFIEDFWLARDPTPGTIENEYKNEHYNRIGQAKKLFSSAGRNSGWNTDRGRIYILLGPPEQRKTWDDPQYTVPLELWIYRGSPEQRLPAYFFLLFYQKIGVNDYRLYMPGMEPVQNLFRVHDPMEYTDYTNMYSELKIMAPELPMAAQSYLPEESLGNILHQGMTFSFSSQLLLNKIETVPHRSVDLNYTGKYREGIVHTEYAFLTMVPHPTYFLWLDKSGNYFLDFSFFIEPQNVTIQSYEEKYYTTFKVEAMLRNQKGERIADYKDRGDLYFTEQQIEKIKNRPMAYLGRMIVTPGKYNLFSQISNLTSKSMGRTTKDIDVLDSGREPVLIGMLPILRYHLIEEKPLPPAPFRTDLYALIPSWRGTFQTKGSGYLFFQMAFSKNWQIDMEAKCLLKYELYQGDNLVKEWQKELLTARQLAGTVLSVIEPVPLKEIDKGFYRLRVSLLGEEETALLNGWFDFEVNDERGDNPVVLTKPLPPLDSLENSRDRALFYYLQNENSRAAEILQKILKLYPEDRDSIIMLASIHIKQKDHETAYQLLNRLLIKEPNDLILLKMVGDCALEMKQYSDAVRFFERVRMQQPEELQNLNKLALAYFAIGQREKARELWEMSLKLDKEQAEIRRLLQVSQKSK